MGSPYITPGPVRLKDPVETIPEEGALARFQLTEQRAASIASLLSLPRDARKRRHNLGNGEADVRFLAARLGVSQRDIRRSCRDKRVLSKVIEQATQAAILLSPDILHQAYKCAMDQDLAVRDRMVAGKLVLEIGKLIKGKEGPQVSVQQNVNVGVQVNEAKDGGIMEDATLRAQLMELKNSGFLDRFLALPAGDSPEPPGSGESPTK